MGVYGSYFEECKVFLNYFNCTDNSSIRALLLEDNFSKFGAVPIQFYISSYELNYVKDVLVWKIKKESMNLTERTVSSIS